MTAYDGTPGGDTGGAEDRQRPSQPSLTKITHDAACECWCWHCTVGPAVDRAIVAGHSVAIDITDQTVVPDVEVIELLANGVDVVDLAGYPAVHRAGHRTAWVLSPGVTP